MTQYKAVEIRIIGEDRKVVEQAANTFNIKLASSKPGRDGGWIGYGNLVVDMTPLPVIVNQPVAAIEQKIDIGTEASLEAEEAST